MNPQSNHWLPLTEYALRSGISISTLRRKIKSNSVTYKMEDGRYLIRSDELSEGTRGGFISSDDRGPQDLAPLHTAPPPIVSVSPSQASGAPAAPSGLEFSAQIDALREEILRMQEDNLLRWKALEARVAGLVKKLDFFSEQMAETKMLVKIFEEKLDGRA